MDERTGAPRLIETEDGSWAIVDDDGERLSVHPNVAGAEAERVRLAQARDRSEHGPDHADHGDLEAEDDPYTDNVGG